ncbi:MAG: hypothetical protein A3H35_18990 [Betaproteobacteria bacterium RIFCSPLOWO2_02_FULL_62_17]|nr:MAG: hypothetical protein A3H35_18990 [Betaproteobacteria bacterium RIFCSPLOWO2_02_FULL_62_17]
MPKRSKLFGSGSAGLRTASLVVACLLPLGTAAGAEADRSALELYGIRLLQTGSRLRNYPEEAFREKLSGTAVVALAIGADGKLDRQLLLRSAGHAVLDDHAMAMLARAVPATEIPTNLRNTAFTIQVSVVFALP